MALTQSFYIQELSGGSKLHTVVQESNKFSRFDSNTDATNFVSITLSNVYKVVKQSSHYIFVLDYNTSNVMIITPTVSNTVSNVFQTANHVPGWTFKQLYISNNKPYLISSDGTTIYTIEHVSANDMKPGSYYAFDINDPAIDIDSGEYITQTTKFQPPSGYVVTYIDYQGNITMYKKGPNPDIKTIKAPLFSPDISGYKPQVRQEPPEPYVEPMNKKNNNILWMLVFLLILFFLYMKHSSFH
jgi:hypothetical protein